MGASPLKTEETIAAIATAPGSGGIGIIRISGPQSAGILERIFLPQRQKRHPLPSHRLCYGKVLDRHGTVLDEAMAVLMRAPYSYTCEDVAEIQSHGSWPVLQAILAEVLAAGARLAEPGEFTKRAFLAGRIDLTRAEAVVDLIEARTAVSAKLAAEQLQGALSERINAVRDALVRILAQVEVAIDFPDDAVELLERDQLQAQLREQVEQPLQRLLVLAEQGRVFREGIKVVIAGRPNVGKSSLLNALLREERALVADLPGTTRDTIEELISVRGIPVHLVDTAGIRDHADALEGLGIERARRKVEQADLVLLVLDASQKLTAPDRELLQSLAEKKRIVVLNKLDAAVPELIEQISQELAGEMQVRTAAKSGNGIEALLDAIQQVVLGKGEELEERLACAPNLRHKMILEKTLTACGQVEVTLLAGESADLLAVDLQTVLDHLADIVGLTTPDDVLDAVFSQFCIGK
ncbi:tRNA uridine-5-carboxymethylaminomethyl(34) synthesis GTPase MnmE [Candidatus Electronema sp. PJ]|uniref:tRNA uridine-5-carboxymethylaminomethyl(34) synthesis GTPase MnmE n=1 Tax=Candidatus Electronema sp. PJ TaxID=3401572 RepID=UPI003AA824B5